MDDMSNALWYWLEGYNYHPNRLEGLYEAIHYYRNKSKHRIGMALYNMCKEVMEFNSEKTPQDILPTTSGFFFGDTEYNEFYYNDIKKTIKFLEEEMDSDGNINGYYFYQSSW